MLATFFVILVIFSMYQGIKSVTNISNLSLQHPSPTSMSTVDLLKRDENQATSMLMTDVGERFKMLAVFEKMTGRIRLLTP